MTKRARGMTFWDFLDEAWPSERGWVTIGLFALLAGLLGMAKSDPHLWDVEVFKVIIQAVFLTGLLNMILAFHFAANKGDETRGQNTAKLADAVKAQAEANSATADATTATNSLGDPLADPEPTPPTGAPGDPVHVAVEEGERP